LQARSNRATIRADGDTELQFTLQVISR
jgi:hypothetical protein